MNTILKDYDLHPLIKEVSMEIYKNGHNAQAVMEAFKRTIKEVLYLRIEYIPCPRSVTKIA